MTPEAIRGRLSALRDFEFTAAERLALDAAQDAREPLGALVRTLEWAEHPDRGKAEFVVKLLGELAILPWLAASPKLDGARKIAALSEALRIYQDLDRRVVEKLRGMLRRQTPVPAPPLVGPVETPVPVTRECDEAFLLLRHLHNPDEPEADDRRYRLDFSRQSETERDDMIRHYLSTGELQ
jgi:hypothetical protein